MVEAWCFDGGAAGNSRCVMEGLKSWAAMEQKRTKGSRQVEMGGLLVGLTSVEGETVKRDGDTRM